MTLRTLQNSNLTSYLKNNLPNLNDFRNAITRVRERIFMISPGLPEVNGRGVRGNRISFSCALVKIKGRNDPDVGLWSEDGDGV